MFSYLCNISVLHTKVSKEQSTLYIRYVIWECSIVLSIQIMLTSCFRLIRLRMVQIYVWIFMNHVCVSEYVRVLSNTIFFHRSKQKKTPSKIQHGDNIYLMPNGFMLSIGKRNIYVSSKEKSTFIAALICIQSQLGSSALYINNKFRSFLTTTRIFRNYTT